MNHIRSVNLGSSRHPVVTMAMNRVIRSIHAFYDNPRKHGLPTNMGLLVLAGGLTGRPLAVMD